MSRAKAKRALAVVPDMDRHGPKWDRVRRVDSATDYVLEETAVLYRAVRTLEAYAMPHDAEQAATVRNVIQRAQQALAEIVVDCGDVREIIREAAEESA